MGIMDNEGHDPMGFGNARSAGSMQADPDPHAALKDARAEIARLRTLVMLGDFSSLRPNSESFKLVQQIRREQSTGEQTSGEKK